MRNVEAIFGGLLALLVLAVAIYMVSGANLTGGSTPPPTGPVASTSSGPVVTPVASADVECQCFDQAFDLAGKDVGVMSSQYRTGFESCRAVGGVDAGDAWTAGWNARLSAKPFQASCRAYKRGRGI